MSEKLVLYRCRTPTNVLCPCGAVARRLHKMDLDFRTQRVPYRRKGRPEIEELTGQERVPVLVDGDEVIHDSKRILQYLEWKHGAAARKAKDEKRKREAKAKKPAKPKAAKPKAAAKARKPTQPKRDGDKKSPRPRSRSRRA